jgi:hypothetical protein
LFETKYKNPTAAILTMSLAAAASTYSFQIAASAFSDPGSGGRAEKALVIFAKIEFCNYICSS